MVELFALVIVKTGNIPDGEMPFIVAGHINVPYYASFFKSKIQHILLELARKVATLVKTGQHQQVKHKDKVAYVIARDGYTGILISCLEYPTRIGFSVVDITLDEFADQHIKVIHSSKKLKDFSIKSFNKYCKSTLLKYQDPTETDDILIAIKKIEKIKCILNLDLEKLLDRGNSLENSLKRTERLDDITHEFLFKTKQPCCVIL